MSCCGGGNRNKHDNEPVAKAVTQDSKYQQNNVRKFGFIPVASIAAVGLIIYYFFQYIV